MYKKYSFFGTRQNVVRCLRAAALLSSVAALSACGILSGAGPYMTSITSASNGGNSDYPYTLIELAPGNIAPYVRPPESAPRKQVAPQEVPEVQLVPGDVIKVLISDDNMAGTTVFAPLAQGGTVFDKVRVNSDGEISLPYMGTKKVSGKNLDQVEAIIRKGVMGRASEPQVHVELVNDLSSSVLVAGAVKSPGRYSALQGPLTILDAINQAGGPVLEPYLINVVLRTGKKVSAYNYQDLLSGGNMPVPPKSEIILNRARERFVAMGAVGKPGLHDLPSSNPTLLEVLGSVGGLSERSANPQGVFVFRLADTVEKGKPEAEVFHLDMREPVSMFLAKKFLVLPEDTIYVTNAPTYELQKIIAPIVQVMLLGRYATDY
ncbi:polysaccharide biosynthesis/export family protein [Burkholderia sp. LA-2-3-30-S1-D2]|uniref:polysaccharide biosynthesis/export family protein n=1 Tax=Burkholderia sp. LA-2-3-30-S1-D2 TaxID=1637862 RepID=UPI000752539E|nr:polysaccharide biosynthesis/export family protein [Burkholderia sp. LA-2-3-30-S1-D2]AOI98849.1 sugar transporter [Burkholderia sp. LA-2-3-30-S1-D2]KVE10560.1 sugar transporter [Burkholderia sp. LA-2-3-30-S1-D2]